MPVRVLENTDQFLAVYKPEGIPFHATEGKRGILQVIREMEDKNEIPKGERLFPVHRLDMVTSGILLFGRGRKAANAIANEFRFSRVEKYYIALSDRPPKKKQGIVLGDMEKGRGGAWILMRSRKKPAVTHFISRAVADRRAGLRLFLLKPKTGRTHQIRAAMKSLGSPILGDPLYGRFDLARKEDRTYLHAYGIRFKIEGQEHSIIVPPDSGVEFLSKEFKDALRTVHDPFRLQFPGGGEEVRRDRRAAKRKASPTRRRH